MHRRWTWICCSCEPIGSAAHMRIPCRTFLHLSVCVCADTWRKAWEAIVKTSTCVCAVDNPAQALLTMCLTAPRCPGGHSCGRRRQKRSGALPDSYASSTLCWSFRWAPNFEVGHPSGCGLCSAPAERVCAMPAVVVGLDRQLRAGEAVKAQTTAAGNSHGDSRSRLSNGKWASACMC